MSLGFGYLGSSSLKHAMQGIASRFRTTSTTTGSAQEVRDIPSSLFLGVLNGEC